jgi:hypothetical protein
MSDTPKWYVTEYPEECSFAVTDGYDIFAMISGGKTVGDECDLANRIAKLPDLERERDEAREEINDIRLNLGADAEGYSLLHAVCAIQNERDEATTKLAEISRNIEAMNRRLREP